MAAQSICGLNDYCLSLIFQFLDINDWIVLCATTKRFRKIIIHLVIPRCLIDVAGPHVNYPMQKIFQIFGNTMTKVRLKTKNGRARDQKGSVFQDFLQMLLLYCEPGLLKEVWIMNVSEGMQNRRIDQGLLIKTAPYFKNVASMGIEFACNDKSTIPMEKWLATIPNHQVHRFRLWFKEAIRYDFTLNPNSFPNLRHFELEHYPSNERTVNAVADFLRKKSFLKYFHVWRIKSTSVVLQNVVDQLPNIEALGTIDLNSNSREIKLEKLECLRSISVVGTLMNYEEFDKLFKILASKATLKNLWIYFDKDVPHLTISTKIQSFIQFNVRRGMIYLEYLEMDFIWRNGKKWDKTIEMYLTYLFTNVFNVKTLRFCYPIPQDFISIIMKNVNCLQTLIIDDMNLSKTFYKELVMERVMVNNHIGTSNRLIICIDGKTAGKCRRQLDLHKDYNPLIISLEPTSKFIGKNRWFS